MTEAQNGSNGHNGNSGRDGRDSNPLVPDPSVIATERLHEAIANLKDLWEAQQATLKSQVDAQFAAIQLQLTTLNHEVLNQIKANDLRYQQRYDAQTSAVAAALAAQKEAVQVALVTVDRATNKTENANEKLMPRMEAESRFKDVEQQIERRFNDLDRNIKTTQETSDRTVASAADAVEKRFITIGESLKLIGLVQADVAKLIEGVSSLSGTIEDKVATLNAKIDSQGEKIAIASAAADKAVTKAEVANEKRFEVNTGLTATLAEQTKNFLTRVEFAATTGALTDKIEDLRKSRDTSTGKGEGANNLWGWIAGAVALIISLVLIGLRIAGH